MSLHAELIAEMQQFCATRPRQSLLRQMIERWIRALASVDTETRAVFEAGWEQGANFEHRSLIEDIELDIAEAYTRYQQSRTGWKP